MIITPHEQTQQIEYKIDCNSIKWREFKVWPILKPQIFFHLRAQNFSENPTHSLFYKFKWSMQHFRRVTNFFKFLRADVLISTDSLENRNINNKLLNKIFFKYQKILGSKHFTFERPQLNSPVSQSVHTSSLLPIIIFVKILSKFLYPFFKIEGVSPLVSNYPNVNFKKSIAEFALYRVFWSFIFKLRKFKVVLISDYYNSMNTALISIAREHSVEVVEFQHGVISRLHPAYYYNNFAHRDSDLLPHKLAAYLLEDSYQTEDFYLPSNKVLHIPHSYLNHALKEEMISPPKWENDPRIKIIVTLQYGHYEDIINFLNVVHKEVSKVAVFILVPRSLTDEIDSQFIVERNLNFYQCLRFANFHCTFSSTCTLEAWLIGMSSFVIELSSIARQYYSAFLPEEALSYAKTPEQLVASIKQRKQESCVNLNSKVVTDDFLDYLNSKDI